MSRLPQISILVPCFNTGRFLRETIASILGQRFGEFELILLDDGSTDGTAGILAEFTRRDARVRAVSRPNRGLVETRNELLGMARGPLISWHDSDDLMTPERLCVQAARMEREPDLVCVGGACTLIDPEGLPIRTHAYPETHEGICRMMEREFACYFGSTLMRREAVLAAGGFRHPFRMCEDFDLLLRLAERGRLANVPEVVLNYRQHMGSTCNHLRGDAEAFAGLARELAAERRAMGSDRLQRGAMVKIETTRAGTRENQVETHRRWGWWALGDGHVKTARKYALHALREAPLDGASWKLFACSVRGY